ncbi:MAG: M23 family metallopeptidase [Pseudomonadota bacterium]
MQVYLRSSLRSNANSQAGAIACLCAAVISLLSLFYVVAVHDGRLLKPVFLFDKRPGEDRSYLPFDDAITPRQISSDNQQSQRLKSLKILYKNAVMVEWLRQESTSRALSKAEFETFIHAFGLSQYHLRQLQNAQALDARKDSAYLANPPSPQISPIAPFILRESLEDKPIRAFDFRYFNPSLDKMRPPVKGVVEKKSPATKKTVQGLYFKITSPPRHQTQRLNATIEATSEVDEADITTIRAPFDGRVVFASQVRYVGQVVIIDHGHHIQSALSGFDEIAVIPGQWVLKGEELGLTNQKRVYFEVYQNGGAVNPLQLLDLKGS